MSNELAKYLNSRRRFRDETAIAKQKKIANSRGGANPIYDKEPHRLAKHHAMDCGNPKCGLCGNPRHIRKGRDGGQTTQERRQHQDVDSVRDRHSNGTLPEEDEK